ncbi:hypothetical protein B0H14DRAFT_2619148 [Mycena olivaceomarginata]|nr:hypothetical protein B0H14DRAFT_2619148 [Mycena olivaceomarginata]
MKENPDQAAQAQLQAPKRVGNGGAPIAKWALHGHKKPQNGLRERSTRQHHMPPKQARGWGLDENSPGPAKRAPWGVKSPKKRAARAQYQATPHAPWASQRIGAGWEQPRACEKGPVGRKKPQNRLRKCSIGCIHCSLGYIHESGKVFLWEENQ